MDESRERASPGQVFESQLSQTNYLQNWYLLILITYKIDTSLALGIINKIDMDWLANQDNITVEYQVILSVDWSPIGAAL